MVRPPMYLLREIHLDLDQPESELPGRIATELKLSVDQITWWSIVRKGIDARKKTSIRRVYSVLFSVADPQAVLTKLDRNPRLCTYQETDPPTPIKLQAAKRVVVVGMGPAGLFAARHLALAGAEVVLLEQGAPVEQRVQQVNRFWRDGTLHRYSNVQFGEGGAGTFSDGKLTSRVKNPWRQTVLQALADCGAPEEILVDAKPHIGTDRLRLILIRLRQQLQSLGVQFFFNTRMTGFVYEKGRLRAVQLHNGETLPCDRLVLAPGHSARETYQLLHDKGVLLESKPFAVGVRVEHPTELINTLQYGRAFHPHLAAADYALTCKDARTGRGVYSFCMCPGGEVIVSSSEEGGLVVNGMSRLARNSGRSNAALVVSVGPDDFVGQGPMAGVRFQQKVEQAAFVAGGGGFHPPAQNLLSFLNRGDGKVEASCRPGVRRADLASILPESVVGPLRRALPVFNRKMKGFVCAEGVLVGVETRTSAPLRILRGRDGQSVSHPGLFPAGEGAGYAGGIMSAALDGIRSAEAVIASV